MALYNTSIYFIYTVTVFLTILFESNADSAHSGKTTFSPDRKFRKYGTNVGISCNLALSRHKGKLQKSEQQITQLHKRKSSNSAFAISDKKEVSIVTVSQFSESKTKNRNFTVLPSVIITDLSDMFMPDRKKRQIFNMLPAFTENSCQKRFKCDYNRDKTEQHCYCDVQCADFNDCCDDYTVNTPKDNNVQLSKFADILTCRVDVIADSLRSFRGYWMVTRCRNGYSNTQIVQRCVFLTKYDIPVTDDIGVVYGNAYCAICNGVNSYRPWKVAFKLDLKCGLNYSNPYMDISTFLSTRTILQQRDCQVSFKPPTTSERKPRICHTLGASLKQTICSKGLSQNIFPLSVMFAMGKTVSNGNSGCFGNQKFDIDTGLCFPKKCHHMDGSGCQQTGITLIQNHKVYINIDLVSPTKLTRTDAKDALTLFMFCLPIKHYGIKLLSLYHPKSMSLYVADDTPLFEVPTAPIYSLVTTNILVYITRSLSFDQIGAFEALLDDIDWSYVHESSSNRSLKIWREKNISYAMTFTNLSVRYVSFGKYALNNIKDKYAFDSLGDGRCRLPKECNVSRLRPSESENNDTDTRERVDISCNFHEKDCQLDTNLSNDNMVQSNILTSNSDMNDNMYIQALLTYISLTLSSAAIIFTAFVQRYIGTAKTTPGHISENILFVMFLFNICFMLGIGMKTLFLCLLLSVMTHYFVLTCFTWISIFVLHTIKTLRRINQFSGRTPRNPPPFPSIFYFFGYVSPLVITIPSLIIDQCDCTSIEIGYTGVVCFPTGFPSSLFIFVGPVIVFVLFNLSCLVYLVCKLFHLNEVVSNKGFSNSRSFVGVYIRLCLLSGLSWGLGVLSEGLNIDTLRYIFIVLTGSHGFIFCVCILSTQVVREDLRGRFSSKQDKTDVNIEVIAS